MRLFVRLSRDPKPPEPKEMRRLQARLRVLEKRLEEIQGQRRWRNGNPRQHS